MCETEIIPIGRAKDIIGERFGRLVVIGRTHNIKKDTAWLCKCDCGNYKIVRTTGLKSGDYVSCGCRRAELNTPDDIKGQKFGRLTALELIDRRSASGDAYWKCQCECGDIVEVKKSRLSGGNTKSCGCLSRESTSKRQSESGLDLTNCKFGRLRVIRPTGEIKNDGRVWYCNCDCGGSIETTARSLNAGRTTSCGCKQIEHVTKLGISNKGKGNPAYNHNLTDKDRAEYRFQRTSSLAKKIRFEAYKRDKFKCKVCNSNPNRKLIAHHLDGFDNHPKKRFDVKNIITLCESCHIAFHKSYGYGSNTKEQFEEFKTKQHNKLNPTYYE